VLGLEQQLLLLTGYTDDALDSLLLDIHHIIYQKYNLCTLSIQNSYFSKQKLIIQPLSYLESDAKQIIGCLHDVPAVLF
jgi:hypothetical protein